MHVDLSRREVAMKVVYFGPALSGKTTNLQALKALLPSSATGRMMTLETRDDRTLFLDLLPVVFRTATEFRVKIRLVTVPGQAMHDATRKVLLEGADGVVFVADSQIRETRANNASFQELRGALLPSVPLVIQFNKRDLPAIRSEAQLPSPSGVPVHTATAIRHDGVRETLASVLSLVWRRQAQRHDLERLLGVDERSFVGRLLGAEGHPP